MNNVNVNVNMNNNVNINTGNHSRHHSRSFEYDPLPLQNGPGGHNHHHERQYSFDDILALNPGILSGVDLDLDPPIPPVSTNSSSTNNSHSTPAELYSLPDPYASILNTNNPHNHNPRNQSNNHSHNSEAWLHELRMGVPGLSLDEMAGTEILNRLRGKMDHVVTRYLPCVDFLVQCQQELRKGLTLATHKRVSYGQRPGRDNMTPRQFYNAYIDLLPQKFYLKNQAIMEHGALTESIHGLNKLISDAKHMERHGCEQIKNTFLGGMKDGESWGLRKWLSKHGNALHVCTDVECVHQAVQKLDRTLDSTRKLAAICRSTSTRSTQKWRRRRIKSSTAHPIPFTSRIGLQYGDTVSCDDVNSIDDMTMTTEEVNKHHQEAQGYK
jgi:ribosomal protein S6